MNNMNLELKSSGTVNKKSKKYLVYGKNRQKSSRRSRNGKVFSSVVFNRVRRWKYRQNKKVKHIALGTVNLKMCSPTVNSNSTSANKEINNNNNEEINNNNSSKRKRNEDSYENSSSVMKKSKLVKSVGDRVCSSDCVERSSKVDENMKSSMTQTKNRKLNNSSRCTKSGVSSVNKMLPPIRRKQVSVNPLLSSSTVISPQLGTGRRVRNRHRTDQETRIKSIKRREYQRLRDMVPSLQTQPVVSKVR